MDGDFAVTEPEPTLPPRPDEAVLLQRAQETRADVAQARSALRIAGLEISKQKGNYLPTITADAGYVWQKTAFPTDQYGYAALRFNVPIWQSGRDRFAGCGGEQPRAAGRPRACRKHCARPKRTCAGRCSTSRPPRPRSSLSQEQLQSAEAEYAQVADLYRSQEATSLDIQSSEANLAEARRAVIVSRIGKLVAELGVFFAAGDLKSAVLKEAQP